jgi:ectoine hydroxylase-related dioxygenase (phytanoyl-CoA dioxygenase family)
VSLALPDLDDRYDLAPEEVASYRANGHVLLRGLARPNEVAAFRPVVSSAVTKFNRESRPLAERDTYGKAFLQVMNLWHDDADVRSFVLAARFAGVAAALLGTDRVRIYHDQALVKEPGGGHTPWHQDAIYWPIDGTRCVTMWMPLVDVTPEMGLMTFVDGSNEGELGDEAISDDSEAHFDALVNRTKATCSVPVAMSAGDATFHGGWTLHKAGANTSSVTREVMTVIYFASDLVVQSPTNEPQRRDLARWLPGLGPGDLAASELNPIIPSAMPTLRSNAHPIVKGTEL